jgi:uracil-DNA glycosylase
MSTRLNTLVSEITACRACALPHEPRPVVWVHPKARILIAGQARRRSPEASSHGTPLSCTRRPGAWPAIKMRALGCTHTTGRGSCGKAMGFCYPGTVNGADLPPRRECAPRWRPKLLPLLKNVRLTLLVGAYAQRYHLGDAAKPSLGETVRAWRDYPEDVMPLPHPSWRNSAWLKRNSWFEAELLPVLRARVASALR